MVIAPKVISKKVWLIYQNEANKQYFACNSCSYQMTDYLGDWVTHSSEYDENCQNWPKLTFKMSVMANFSRILVNRYNIWNQRIKLHHKKCGERNFQAKNKKGSTYCTDTVSQAWLDWCTIDKWVLSSPSILLFKHVFPSLTDLDLLFLLLKLALMGFHHVLQLLDEVLLHLELLLHILYLRGSLGCLGGSLSALSASPPHGAGLGSLGHHKLKAKGYLALPKSNCQQNSTTEPQFTRMVARPMQTMQFQLTKSNEKSETDITNLSITA